MPSSIAWLDFSEEEQRRAREIIALFSQQESRDELGIGTVRDALSDSMFPGLSVIQTRARYFLFVPWLFVAGKRRGRTGSKLVSWVELQERKLIEALRSGGYGHAGDGLIGRVAGMNLKILPSTIYWTGLQRFRILRHSGTIEQVAGETGAATTVEEALTEMVDRPGGIWDPNLPEPPESFLKMTEASFRLKATEADWLAERIATSAPDTLFAWLVTAGHVPGKKTEGLWDDPTVREAPAKVARAAVHAERFSFVMHGAALVYNLLVAEKSHEVGFDPQSEQVETYRARLSEWDTEFRTQEQDFLGWNRSDFWNLVVNMNARVPFPTRVFADRWIDLATSGNGATADRADARSLVGLRERQMKRGQSRLTNERLLRQWGGNSGADRLTFRWTQVKQVLRDIDEGRRAHARP